MNILDEIKQNKYLLSDGAWGTLLQVKGIKPGECPELWNINNRFAVLDIALSYADAGADIIETNSFGANRFKLDHYGLTERVSEINEVAAAISREAAGKNRYVAGSVGPTGKILLTGDVTESEIYDAYREQTIALERGGADIIIIETMSATDEASIAVKASVENTKCTVIVTFTFNKSQNGEYHTFMGATPDEMTETMKAAGAHIIGSNCGNGIEDMIGIVKAIREIDKDIPVIIQPNAGTPQYVDGRTVFRETPQIMASFVPDLIKAGVNIIGGCCGTTPDHIRELRKIISR